MRSRTFLFSVLAFGYAFLYLPVVLLVIYSFNESRLVTVWSRFSTKWYAALLENDRLLESAWLSVKIAATNASAAVILGTLAANALVRYRRFRGRTGFNLLLTAPLVMPDVIIGLSLLLLFVATEQLTGWPEGRGFGTIAIAHITFSLAYVAIVVKSRLARIDPALEEAALDLGASPLTAFLRITLPLIAPALIVAVTFRTLDALRIFDLVYVLTPNRPETLSMSVYARQQLVDFQSVGYGSAASTLLFATVAALTVAWLRYGRRHLEERQS